MKMPILILVLLLMSVSVQSQRHFYGQPIYAELRPIGYNSMPLFEIPYINAPVIAIVPAGSLIEWSWEDQPVTDTVGVEYRRITWINGDERIQGWLPIEGPSWSIIIFCLCQY